jgi:hypothetical protein
MHAHLWVISIPVVDPNILGDLETRILAELDPPLNLAKVARTLVRRQLSALRKQYAGATAQTGGPTGSFVCATSNIPRRPSRHEPGQR